MDIIFITNQIKYDILNISGLSAEQCYNLTATTPLYSIGYGEDESLCRKLESKLQAIADEYNTGKLIQNGHVSKDTTVYQCIKLVIL
ncbi:hypothetical protein [Mucilaginibacter sp.]|jgi:hypothetical protein|uniref:hypothetical protein n=1 Tax=Mucilaginibacter sp. TaxID=1882438 RepID=UPI003564FC63